MPFNKLPVRSSFFLLILFLFFFILILFFSRRSSFFLFSSFFYSFVPCSLFLSSSLSLFLSLLTTSPPSLPKASIQDQLLSGEFNSVPGYFYSRLSSNQGPPAMSRADSKDQNTFPASPNNQKPIFRLKLSKRDLLLVLLLFSFLVSFSALSSFFLCSLRHL